MSKWPAWPRDGRVALDLESNDPDLKSMGPGWRRDAYIAGTAIAFEDGTAGYLPCRHEAGGNENEEHVIAYLRDQAKTFRGTLVGANITYDLDGLWEKYGIKFQHATLADVLVAAKLHDSRYFEVGPWGAPGYSLDQCLTRAGMPGKDEGDMLRAWQAHPSCQRKDGSPFANSEKTLKKNLWRLHAQDVAPYAEWDAYACLPLLRHYETTGEGLPAVWALEQDVTAMLLDLRWRGMRFDEEGLARVTTDLESVCVKEQQALDDLCGVHVRSGAAVDLAPHLQRAGFELKRTKAGGPSVDKAWLKANPHVLTRAILTTRAADKMLSSAKSMPKFIVNGRVHPILKQIGAVTGRMACANPNVQQSSTHAEVAKAWRGLFLPEPGMLYMESDYKTQEPRWLAHWAKEAGYPDFAQRYVDDVWFDTHDWTAAVCGIPRKAAKTILLAKSYGMGGAKLCRSLGLPTDGWRSIAHRDQKFDSRGEAMAAFKELKALGFTSDWEGPKVWESAGDEGRALIRAFDDGFPELKLLNTALQQSVKACGGYLYLFGGRKMHVSAMHKILNIIGQGSAAVHTKRAAVAVWKEFREDEFAMSMIVHDSLDGSVRDETVARRIGEVMSRDVGAHVPFIAEPAVGPSWGGCVKLKL